MIDLIKRLEEATEGSPKLDLAILNSVSGHEWRFCMAGRAVTWDRYGPDAAGNPVCSLEPYTTSLDAALTLVPQGWRWQVSDRAPKPHVGRAFLNNGEMQLAGIGGGRNPKFKASEVTAYTPALALCIAALKARL